MDNKAKAGVIDLALRTTIGIIMIASICAMVAFPPFAVVLLVLLLF